MKKLTTVIIALVLFVLSGCNGEQSNEPYLYNAVINQTLRLGMTRDAVEAILGEPKREISDYGFASCAYGGIHPSHIYIYYRNGLAARITLHTDYENNDWKLDGTIGIKDASKSFLDKYKKAYRLKDDWYRTRYSNKNSEYVVYKPGNDFVEGEWDIELSVWFDESLEGVWIIQIEDFNCAVYLE